jgi:hypothetical protein
MYFNKFWILGFLIIIQTVFFTNKLIALFFQVGERKRKINYIYKLFIELLILFSFKGLNY